ncbi:MAG: transposase [Planctomycetia bacterium]|nr:transposase [Planctomycetia bacterium]
MPRPLRPIAPGLVYHVVNRGNNRQNVFFKTGDYEAFLTALLDLQQRKPFALYGYCLMSNHFHLLIRPQQHSISQLLQSVLVSHTQRYHKHRNSLGHVWQGRFKSPVIEDDDHLLTVLRYIEANPVRAEMVERASEYRWSSYASHASGAANELLSVCQPYEQLSAYAAVRQRRWEAYVDQTPDADELAAIRRSVERSLPFGSEAWVEKLSKNLELDLTIRPRGRPKTSTTDDNK